MENGKFEKTPLDWASLHIAEMLPPLEASNFLDSGKS
jgi:hypothetical protein